LTNKPEYFEKSFQFSERGKSASFLASLKDLKALDFGGIPDSLLRKEKNLKSELAAYNEFLFEAAESEDTDSAKIMLWEGKVFELEQKYEKLVALFEDEYPDYHALKYSNEIIPLRNVQENLSEDQSIVEYVLKEPEEGKDGEVIAFVITKDNYTVKRSVLDQSFNNNIKRFLYFLKEKDPIETTVDDFAEYSKVSHYLYDKLILPVKDDIEGDRVIFIQEGIIRNLPMEALIGSMPDTSEVHFSDIDYLINDYAVSYSYSATLLFRYFKQKRKADEEFLGISPEYNNEEIDINPRLGQRGILSPLHGARREVEVISEMINGMALTGDMATAESFKEGASNYDILHLAMHTDINDTLPMNSKLIFSHANDSSNRESLNTGAIYNMKFNARMAVLSACNSGSGYMYKSEGAMSLARAFMYSGCPSVVMTLWSVADKPAAAIMINFYHHLLKGKTKDVALRKAKLKYLNSVKRPINAHPKYWLGFVSIGDQSALFFDYSSLIIMLLVAIGTIVLLIPYIARKKKNGN
jgi:CHAT domain-containing protein